jgi:hypothetical protein
MVGREEEGPGSDLGESQCAPPTEPKVATHTHGQAQPAKFTFYRLNDYYRNKECHFKPAETMASVGFKLMTAFLREGK